MQECNPTPSNHPSYLIRPCVTTKCGCMLANLPHKVEVELAGLAETLALHDTGDHAVTDGPEVGDGREVIEDDSGRHQAPVYHATELQMIVRHLFSLKERNPMGGFKRKEHTQAPPKSVTPTDFSEFASRSTTRGSTFSVEWKMLPRQWSSLNCSTNGWPVLRIMPCHSPPCTKVSGVTGSSCSKRSSTSSALKGFCDLVKVTNFLDGVNRRDGIGRIG